MENKFPDSKWFPEYETVRARQRLSLLKKMAPKIKVKNRLTYPAMFIFGTDTKLKVSSHAIERFLERDDPIALEYAPEVLERPEDAVVTMYKMVKAGQWVKNPKKNDSSEEKYGTRRPCLYLECENWTFVIRQETVPTIITCYPF